MPVRRVVVLGLGCLERSFRTVLVTSRLYRFLFELLQHASNSILHH
jgi:hypothetical protein